MDQIPTWAAGVIAVVTAAVSLGVTQLIKWKDNRTKNRIEQQRANTEDRERLSHIDMALFRELSTKYQEALNGYETRFSNYTKRVEEREQAFQEVIDNLQNEHHECLKKNAEMAGELASLKMRVADLEAKIERRSR